ncbi:MAG: UDP-N-acetylmuramoyl-tripeptide--D-alanyl-D-alanine ligase [Solirubrobacteraceae bacterium]
MKDWTPALIAEAAGARLLAGADAWGGPERVSIDSRDAGPGTLFVGLPGEKVDGGAFASRALAAGAWGVLTAPEHASDTSCGTPGVWLAADDPLKALQRLATSWRRTLGNGGAKVIGVTGSTGKTSTKDLLQAVLKPHRTVVASRANFNTEIGLPLELLAAPAGTEVIVLEMGMRGAGQIAELAQIAEPDVGVIVSIGPVHVELLGTVEAVAAAKAELIASLESGATAVIPAGEELLAPHIRTDLNTVTFGDEADADVRLIAQHGDQLQIDACGRPITLEVDFTQAHLRRNLLAAVAAALAVGVVPAGHVELELSPGRGQRVELADGITLIDDCYNANPMSMAAALADLVATASDRGRRRVAVLGDMLELGAEEIDYHVELGRQAAAAGIEVLVTVGQLAHAAAQAFAAAAPQAEMQATDDAAQAAALLPIVVRRDDVVLVKASRGVGLEAVCSALAQVAAR